MLGSSGKGMLICLFFFIQPPTQGCTVRKDRSRPTLYLKMPLPHLPWFALLSQHRKHYLLRCVHTQKQTTKQNHISTYINTHIDTYIYVFNLTGSKLSSTYTDAVVSRDLLQSAFCYMYLRILFQPLKLI